MNQRVRAIVRANQRRLLALILLAYLAFVANEYRLGYLAAAHGDSPLYTDFTTLYAASMHLHADPAETLYLPRRAHAYQLSATAAVYGPSLSEPQVRDIGYSPWMYPPTFMLFALPIAAFPYLPALGLWLMLTGWAYVAAVRRMLGPGGGLFALASPPAFFNLMFGQTGFLSAGLIGLGLSYVRTSPLLAGALIGLASFKPHLGVLLPLALAAGGHWRCFAAATASVLGLMVVSGVLFGIDAWYGFIGATIANFGGFAAGAYAWKSMASVLSTAVMAGLSIDSAWRLQIVASAIVALLVAWVWWRGRSLPETAGLQAATVCLATPLVVPMVYFYDLAIIVPGVAWVWADFRRHGARVWERGLLFGSFAAMLGALYVASRTGIQLGGILAAVLAIIGLARFRAALARATDTAPVRHCR